MAILFDITTPTNTLVLDPQRRAEASFTVTNTSGQVLRARGRAVTESLYARRWLRVVGEPERTFMPEQTSQYTVAVVVPQDAPQDTYTFRLAMVEEENPDENYFEGPTVSFTVRNVPAPPLPRGINILLIILGVLAALGLLVLIGWAVATTIDSIRRGPINSAATNPALIEHGGVLYLIFRPQQDSALHWARYSIAQDAWSAPQPLPINNVRTATSPSLTSHDNTLYLAYRGDQDEQIYLADYNITTNRWSGGEAIRDENGNFITTRTSPSLTQRDGTLYLAYRGADDTRLSLSQRPVRGQTWTLGQLVTYEEIRSGALTRPWASTLTSPLLVWNSGQLHLLYTPLGSTISVMLTLEADNNWRFAQSLEIGRETSGQMLEGLPAIARHDTLVYLVFRYADGTLTLVTSSSEHFTNMPWVGQNIVSMEDDQAIMSRVAPALAQHDGVLYLIHTRSSGDSQLYWSIYNTTVPVEERQWRGNKPIGSPRG